MGKKVIIFDLWQTIAFIKTKPSQLLKSCLNLNDEEVDDFIFNSGFFTKNQKFETIIKKHFKNKYSDDLVKDFINKWHKNNKTAYLDDQVKELILTLKKNYVLVLLTNVDKDGFESFPEKAFLENNFDHLHLSYISGFVKPNTEYLKMILNKCSIAPENVVMIGDSYQLDILPANALGINSILVCSDICVIDSRFTVEKAIIESIVPLLDKIFNK